MSPAVSIIIVNYNTCAYLSACLSSIASQTFQDHEVIIFDNASGDNSLQFVRKQYPHIRLIESKNNIGFAGGNNKALEHAQGKHVFFLNPDTELAPDCLLHLITAAEKDPEAGMFAPKVKFTFDHDQFHGISHIMYPDGLNRCRGYLEEDHGQYDTECDILSPPGAAAFFLKEAVDTVGGFDADFFMYGDDLDLGLRIRLAGWQGVSVPQAVVYHAYSGATGQYSPRKAFFVERNRIWVLFKLFPVSLILISPLYTLMRYCYTLYAMVIGRGPSGKFVEHYPAWRLFFILIHAWCSALIGLPKMLRKRRAFNRIKKLSACEIKTLLKKHRISVQELTLKD